MLTISEANEQPSHYGISSSSDEPAITQPMQLSSSGVGPSSALSPDIQRSIIAIEPCSTPAIEPRPTPTAKPCPTPATEPHSTPAIESCSTPAVEPHPALVVEPFLTLVAQPSPTAVVGPPPAPVNTETQDPDATGLDTGSVPTSPTTITTTAAALKEVSADRYPKFITTAILTHLSGDTNVEGWLDTVQMYLKFENASPSKSVSGPSVPSLFPLLITM